MRRFQIILFVISVFISSSLFAQNKYLLDKPPMGWNSYNCFGATVNESEVKANADYMEVYLKDYGWEYIVIDYCWFSTMPGAMSGPEQTEDYKPPLTMDRYGRLLPAVDRFPSAKGGKGFKPLADYVHEKGLKFGIHMMHGIPRQAVAKNVPIFGTDKTAKDIANPDNICFWLNHMYGVDMSKEGAQEYYDSLIRLYANWGVDYIKYDDMLAGGKYYKEEIIAVRRAIDKCGRKIVLSISPGNDAPVAEAEFIKKYADLWRISGDFWDEWELLKRQFEICERWASHIKPEHWPDADMLQLGRLSRRGPVGEERESKFTRNEQYTHMTLWAIFRSPLMFGGDLTLIRPFPLSLLRNREVLAVNQNSINNRQLFRRGNHVAWTADVPNSNDKYLAVFNLGEDKETPVYVLLSGLGIEGKCKIRDLWRHKELGTFEKDFIPLIPVHGAGLYRISLH